MERPIKRIIAQVRSKESMKQYKRSGKGDEGAERKRDADTDLTNGIYRIR